VEIHLKPEINLPLHPVGWNSKPWLPMEKGRVLASLQPGGGALLEEGEYPAASVSH
jgi:hypothetical protein